MCVVLALSMEQLDVFDIKGKYVKTEGISDFYVQSRREYAVNGHVTRQVKTVMCLLMNAAGDVYLQRRNVRNMQNAGLLDKTVGGHVSSGLDYDEVLKKECFEELGMSVSIVSPENFYTVFTQSDMAKTGVLKQIDIVSPFYSTRICSDGTFFEQPFMSAIYLGYYEGPFVFLDQECEGVERAPLDIWLKRIQDNPDAFTGDIKKIFTYYCEHIKPLPRLAD